MGNNVSVSGGHKKVTDLSRDQKSDTVKVIHVGDLTLTASCI